jgi:hypothetical protein
VIRRIFTTWSRDIEQRIIETVQALLKEQERAPGRVASTSTSGS